MSTTHGRFVWYELMTTDTAAARTFYSHVVGWGTQETDMAGPPYTMFTAAGTPVAGLMPLPEEVRKLGIPPFWIGYVGVDDVDATAAQAAQAGATMRVEPTDIPNVGRFAVFSDPQGATIALFKWLNAMQGEPPARGTPGRIGWHELMASDWQQAFPFYAALFGWRKGEAVDIGPMGTYQLFGTTAEAMGGMVNKPPAMPVASWLYYFNVGEIDPAATRLQQAGGTILNGPMQVPGGDWIVQASDPQGAMFAVVGTHA